MLRSALLLPMAFSVGTAQFPPTPSPSIGNSTDAPTVIVTKETLIGSTVAAEVNSTTLAEMNSTSLEDNSTMADVNFTISFSTVASVNATVPAGMEDSQSDIGECVVFV